MSAPAPPRVERLPDPESVAGAAALHFARLAAAALAARGVFRVALSGGSTPRRLHQRLAAEPLRAQVDWRAVEFFWGDERAVPPDCADSNFRMARETLLEPLGIAPERVHRMPAERADLDSAARDYAEELARAFGIEPQRPPPRFDLLLLGMGGDGHTASLFPHTAALSERRQWVVANRVPQLDTERLTLTYPVLNAARRVLFLVTGAEKAAVLREVLEGPRDPERLPSQGVEPRADEQGEPALTWLVDEAAAAALAAGRSPRPPR